MLARIWSGPEAISVWVELVTERKRVIQSLCDGSQMTHYPTLAASQQEITRSELAEWDASARAWIRAADEAKKRQQRQLMLILDNETIPVNDTTDVYRSVVQAWMSAMTTMESLVKGMPQRVQNGSILLALSAWHLYPNMVVLGETTTDVHQNDPLIRPGGYLTIGLENSDPTHGDGVYWSLSLAHLRYYGDPILSSRSAGSNGSRISFEDLTLAILGSIFSGWGSLGSDIILCARFFPALWSYLIQHARSENVSVDKTLAQRILTSSSSWLSILVNAANTLIESEGLDRAQSSMLVRTGFRRGPSFLAPIQKHPCPVFGLADLSILLPLMRDEEHRIEALRKIASKYDPGQMTAIIRYKVRSSFYEYATATPLTRGSMKRSSENLEMRSGGHMRWTPFRDQQGSCLCSKECNSSCLCIRAQVSCSQSCHDLDDCQNMSIEDTQLRIDRIRNRGEECIPFVDSQIRYYQDETWFALQESLISGRNTYPWEREGSTETDSELEFRPNTIFSFVCGDLQTAALFIRDDTKDQNSAITNQVDMEDLIQMFNSDVIRVDALTEHLDGYRIDAKTEEYFRSLKAVASAAEIYKLLPNATVVFSVISQPLYKAHWIPQIHAPTQKLEEINKLLEPFPLSRQRTIACVVMFETGTWNLPLEPLAKVMAISSGDSIYVIAPLLCDPYEAPHGKELRRVVGNVGRAGMALLVSPQNPRIRPLAFETWQLINHAEFDGAVENCFQNTSMHLSFTGYETPVGIQPQGSQDREATVVETAISLHDRGKWIGDVDIVSMFMSKYFHRISPYNCSHGQTKPTLRLTSIDCWEELLDRPLNGGVVRADGNWLARLAAAAIGVQKQYHTFVLSTGACWRCCTESVKKTITGKDLEMVLFVN